MTGNASGGKKDLRTEASQYRKKLLSFQERAREFRLVQELPAAE